jgi:hypothetical protein
MAGQNGIHDSLAAMRTALRVLVALSDRKAPASDDVAMLCQYSPDLAHLPLDDFAREVVLRMCRARARTRGNTSR